MKAWDGGSRGGEGREGGMGGRDNSISISIVCLSTDSCVILG